MSGCRARQNQPSTFSICIITEAMHVVVIESELYISYANFKTLHAANNASLNYLSRTEWAWMRVWLSFWGSSSLLSSPHLLLCKSWGEVVALIGSCGGADSDSYSSPPSYPVFHLPLSLNVVKECCMKSIRQLLSGNGPSNLSWELLLLLLLLLLQCADPQLLSVPSHPYCSVPTHPYCSVPTHPHYSVPTRPYCSEQSHSVVSTAGSRPTL